MNLQKTKECCGRKPRRFFVQTSFRDDEGCYEIKCRKCTNKVITKNKHDGTHIVECETVEEWNKLLGG